MLMEVDGDDVSEWSIEDVIERAHQSVKVELVNCLSLNLIYYIIRFLQVLLSSHLLDSTSCHGNQMRPSLVSR